MTNLEMKTMNARTMSATAAIIVAGCLFAAGEASAAVPAPLSHQGRLLDASGQPVSAAQIFIYKIYDAPTGGNVLWTETLTVPIDQGYFSVQLGTSTAITNAILTGGPRFLGIQVGTDPEMTPREALASVPYARVAGEVSGDIHPNSVTVNGTAAINSSGKWVGPAPLTVTDCQPVTGPCGAGTFDKPTYYLDRVGGTCPADHPILNGIHLQRCGDLGTPDEGLGLTMTCCALK
jgi:hypothetical protein